MSHGLIAAAALPSAGRIGLGYGERANLWGSFRLAQILGSRDEGEPVSKLVWRVKLVAELQPGLTTEVDVACLERDDQACIADLGLRLSEAKRLTAALQAEMVPAQVGECQASCRSHFVTSVVYPAPRVRPDARRWPGPPADPKCAIGDGLSGRDGTAGALAEPESRV
jgi:hypothetical protein